MDFAVAEITVTRIVYPNVLMITNTKESLFQWSVAFLDSESCRVSKVNWIILDIDKQINSPIQPNRIWG